MKKIFFVALALLAFAFIGCKKEKVEMRKTDGDHFVACYLYYRSVKYDSV